MHLKLDTRMKQSRADLSPAKSDLLASPINNLLIFPTTYTTQQP